MGKKKRGQLHFGSKERPKGARKHAAFKNLLKRFWQPRAHAKPTSNGSYLKAFQAQGLTKTNPKHCDRSATNETEDSTRASAASEVSFLVGREWEALSLKLPPFSLCSERSVLALPSCLDVPSQLSEHLCLFCLTKSLLSFDKSPC